MHIAVTAMQLKLTLPMNKYNTIIIIITVKWVFFTSLSKFIDGNTNTLQGIKAISTVQ